MRRRTDPCALGLKVIMADLIRIKKSSVSKKQKKPNQEEINNTLIIIIPHLNFAFLCHR